jgi:hypothetical protein
MRFDSGRCLDISSKPVGARLRHLFQINRDPTFKALIEGEHAQPWSAWLMSLGPDDLLDAVQMPALGRVAHRPNLRLLCKKEE